MAGRAVKRFQALEGTVEGAAARADVRASLPGPTPLAPGLARGW